MVRQVRGMSLKHVEYVPDVLDGRAGFRLSAEWGHIAAVFGGGHICELARHSHPGVNPLWRPPWNTIDPESYLVERDGESYGPPPDGRLLAGIAGHTLAFDYFGPPSPEETAAGLGTHGEAPAVRWHITAEFDDPGPGVEYGAMLPVVQMDFRRTVYVDREHPVVYFRECARNLSCADRPIGWNQHVTVGPPFLECGITLVDMPASLAKTMLTGNSGERALIADAEFPWPRAPLQGGGSHDLRTTPKGCYSRYSAQLIAQHRKVGYVAIGNLRLGLLLAYVFRRADFPWIGSWEERAQRQQVPWRGNTFCRGLEFSTTPFPVPKRTAVSDGLLFGEHTFRWLPARAEAEVRYLATMVVIPSDFQGVGDVSLGDRQITFHESRGGRSISVPADGAFLFKESGAQDVRSLLSG